MGGEGKMKGEKAREKRRKKETQRDRQKATQGQERTIPHNHVLLLCGNVQERAFINIVDTKHSLIQTKRAPCIGRHYQQAQQRLKSIAATIIVQ